MTASLASDAILAADISASGDFIAVGRRPAQAPRWQPPRGTWPQSLDPDRLNIAVYSLASNAFGLCVLDGGDIEAILQACLATQLVAVWRLEIPGTGLLQALFTVARFEPGTMPAGPSHSDCGWRVPKAYSPLSPAWSKFNRRIQVQASPLPRGEGQGEE